MVLQEEFEIQLLNTIEERTVLIKNTGLDNLIIHPFDKSFSLGLSSIAQFLIEVDGLLKFSIS